MKRRVGFTLVELLIVLGILLVLLALTLGVLTKVWQQVDESRTVIEVNATSWT